MMKKSNSLLNYFTQSLNGAWQFIKLNPRAMEYFDTSAESFWKSFWAIALLAPVFFIGLILNPETVSIEDYEITAVARTVEFLLKLPLIAVVMILFTKFLKIDAYYSNMIIAFNWLWVISNYIILPLSILINLGILPVSAGIIVMAMVVYLELYVTWFMFRQSLKISGWLAFGVMVFKLLFTLSVMQFIIRVF